MKEPALYHSVSGLALVFLALLMNPFVPFIRDQGEPCTEALIPDSTFLLKMCVAKTEIRLGEVVSLTSSFINTANQSYWISETMRVFVVHQGTIDFEDIWGCFIPEGCYIDAFQSISWTFHWTPSEPNSVYNVHSELLYLGYCNPPACFRSQIDGDVLHLVIVTLPSERL